MLLKISGSEIASSTLVNPNDMIIQFGNICSKIVHLVTEDTIICSSPSSLTPGQVTIQISFDEGKNLIDTGLKFTFLSNDEDSHKRFVNYYFNESENNKPFKKVKRDNDSQNKDENEDEKKIQNEN